MSVMATAPNPVPTPELLWRQYHLQVDLYKTYLKLLLKFNVFYYAATGAIVSYYFSKPDIPLMKYSLWFPILMSIGFAILFIYGASQTHVVRQELFDIRDKLGLDTAPEYRVLYIFLWISSILMLIAAMGLLVMLFDMKVAAPLLSPGKGGPMTNAEIVFAVIVGAISAIGLIWGSKLTSLASDRAARSARDAMEHQTKLNAKAKVAEFRQAWINNLRDAMAKLMRQGLGAPAESDVIEATAKIQLLMNKKDERYPELTKLLKEYVVAMKSGDQQYNSSKLLELCQDILKNEWEVLKKELLELKSVN